MNLDGVIPTDRADYVLNLSDQENATVNEIYDLIKSVMEQIGTVRGLHVFVVKGEQKTVAIVEMPELPMMRDMMILKLKTTLAEMDPDFIMTVAEAWAIARTAEGWNGEMPSAAKDRLEMCVFTFEARDGRRGFQSILIFRDQDKKVRLPDTKLSFMEKKKGTPSGRIDNLLGEPK